MLIKKESRKRFSGFRRQGKIAADSLILFCSGIIFIMFFSGFFARLDNWLHD
ncbi:MAG: hypothetical protein ACD_39C00803G0001, partial [uncultured bacterium]